MLFRDAILLLALGPLVYYVLALWVSAAYFRSKKQELSDRFNYTPPARILKPVRGLDREAYENFASFCQLDYPEYEVLFCVLDPDDPAVSVIEKLQVDFPDRRIRLLMGAPAIGASGKVNKLCRLVQEASYDLLVISDSDVRVEPNYLQEVAAPFADPKVGAVTVFFRSLIDGSMGATLDAAGSAVEFAASALLARRLEGIHFTLGATMATTKERLAEIGGFEVLANHYVDDYELGNRIAQCSSGRTCSYRIHLRTALDDLGRTCRSINRCCRLLCFSVSHAALRGLSDRWGVGIAGRSCEAELVASAFARFGKFWCLGRQFFYKPNLLARA